MKVVDADVGDPGDRERPDDGQADDQNFMRQSGQRREQYRTDHRRADAIADFGGPVYLPEMQFRTRYQHQRPVRRLQREERNACCNGDD